jgi:hypothetical protein
VSNVRVSHQKAVIPDDGASLLFNRPAVDRDTLSNHIAITDHDAGGLTSVTEILRFTTDYDVGEDAISGSELNMSLQLNMPIEAGAGTDDNVGAYDTKGTDFHIIGELCTRVDQR